ncbi:MAG: 16S rRNA (adenine(1518)-N(6)/adenine(1519)-N(6))-dimethyltransferase RsmA [Candidatus Cloacimonetes bacterium]|nr:16S rRNA (adenine(1518)-N(6)/adenine(1519)-N(6))-dimethyltransferase RsmA [Candidatus Cloacimonadota bacterium]
MTEFYQKKSLGQHFLKDKNIVKKIVRVAEVDENESVWEIGPGKGILTEELLETNCNLTCFEIDEELYPILEDRFGNKIKLIKQDVLKANWKNLVSNEKIKIVANLPYQITSPILFKIIEFSDSFSKITIMIQKEVAERIKSSPNTKQYGALSLKMQFHFDIKYEFTVRPQNFSPPPKVDSAVISLIPRKDKPNLENKSSFWQIVNVAFQNRRKMLRRNFRNLLNPEKIVLLQEKSGINLSKRAENLTENDFIQIYKSYLDLK